MILKKASDTGLRTTRFRDARLQNPFKVGIVLLLVGISVACIQHKIPTIMMGIMEQFAMSSAAASWLMSIFALIGVAIAIPTGSLAQRFGFKKVMLVALALILVGTSLGLVAGALHSGPALIVSRAIEGAAMTVVTACGPIAVNQCVPRARIGTAMGLWGNWGATGAVIAAILVPTVFRSMGFSWVWILFAIFTVVSAVLFIVFIRDPHTQSDPGQLSEDTEPSRAQQELSPLGPPRYRELLNRNILLFLLGFASFNLALLGLLGYLPSILQLRGISPTMSGFIATFPSLLSIVSVPIFGMISDRIGRAKPLLIATYIFFGPCVFLMFTNVGVVLWIAAVLLGLIGFGCIGLFLIGWSNVLPRPELLSLAMGVLILVQCLGQFLGTYVVQLFLGPDLANWEFAGIAIMVIGLLGTASLMACKLR
jgi:MFS family permease